MNNGVSLINKPEISAIYYALLHSNYDFYALEKDYNLIRKIEGFQKKKCDFDISFFSKVKQNSCEVYPYWPRAFSLETATFYICNNSWTVKDFNTYKQRIMSSQNIAEGERNQVFWEWVQEFPTALRRVMTSNDFKIYFEWEELWIHQQNNLLEKNLQYVQKIIDICKKRYNSPVNKMSIILNPIKCAYSSDYIKVGNEFFCILGSFRIKSIIHEYLHHVVHQFIPRYDKLILNITSTYPDVDPSYYLNGDEIGKINAFEEYIVCNLTSDIANREFPLDLDDYIKESINKLIL